jgi:hypothetical protein
MTAKAALPADVGAAPIVPDIAVTILMSVQLARTIVDGMHVSIVIALGCVLVK